MTSNIQQHVSPRRRTGVPYGRTWKSKSFITTQRGSVDHGTVTVMFGLVAVIAVGLLGFFYLKQVMGTSEQGTDIHALETQIVEMRERQRELELEGAQLRSLQTVENRVNKLNLVATDRVTYLATTSDQLAAAVD